MKKIVTYVLFSFLSISVFAGSSLFSYDSEKVDQTFASLDKVELYINQHPTVQLNDLLAENNSILKGMDVNAMAMAGPLAAAWSIDDMDWGSFAWGFCCWPVGFFVVAINDAKTNDQKLSYWIGLGVSVVLNTVAAAAGAFSSITTF